MNKRKLRQLLDEYDVEITTFARTSGIPWFSVWFTVNVYPLPSVTAALYHYTFMLAALELAIRLSPRAPDAIRPRFELEAELTKLSRVIAMETVTKILANQELEPMEEVTERFNALMRKYWAGEPNA
ncbi:MAG TPA: hypothetical protein VNB49_04180 [Candidatus Dormibacteraeota bacterium]|nr:hypothetical protein [Candidatus Dormibacteraeota bacterium]